MRREPKSQKASALSHKSQRSPDSSALFDHVLCDALAGGRVFHQGPDVVSAAAWLFRCGFEQHVGSAFCGDEVALTTWELDDRDPCAQPFDDIENVLNHARENGFVEAVPRARSKQENLVEAHAWASREHHDLTGIASQETAPLELCQSPCEPPIAKSGDADAGADVLPQGAG